MSENMSLDEKIAINVFKTIDGEYEAGYGLVLELETELKDKGEEFESLNSQYEELKKGKKDFKSPSDLASYKVKINELKEKLEEQEKDIKSIEDKLAKSKVTIDNCKRLFGEKIPAGEKLLQEMKQADREKRFKTKHIQLDSKAIILENKTFELQVIKNFMQTDEEFKNAMNLISEYPHSKMELFITESKGQLTPEQEKELKAYKTMYLEKKKDAQKILKSNGVNSFDFKQFEDNVLNNEGITVEQNLSLINKSYIDKRQELKIEQSEISKYYNDIVNEEELESTEIVKDGFFSKLKRKIGSFFDKFRKNKREDDKEKPEENENQEISESFKKRISKSEMFKSEIEEQAKIDDEQLQKRMKTHRNQRDSDERNER